MFKMQVPDIQSLIKELDLLDENVDRALITAVDKAGDTILNAQKALIAPKSKLLSNAMKKSRVYVTRRGQIHVKTGYFGREGKIGMNYEFGRPGEKKKLRIIKKNGEEIVVKTSGAIQAVPHMRRGAEKSEDAAAKILTDAVEEELKKAGGE